MVSLPDCTEVLYPALLSGLLSACHVPGCLCFARADVITSCHVSKFKSLLLANEINSAWGCSNHKNTGYNNDIPHQRAPKIKNKDAIIEKSELLISCNTLFFF